jgi:hypothetical protein
MKKLIASLFTALCMTVGLVAVSGGAPANAAPYPGTVKTTTVVKAPAKVKHSHKDVKIKPVVRAGSTSPKGTVTMTVKLGHKVIKKITRTYKAGRYFTVKLAKKGKYTVTVVFTPAKNSVWKKSTTHDVVRAR